MIILIIIKSNIQIQIKIMILEKRIMKLKILKAMKIIFQLMEIRKRLIMIIIPPEKKKVEVIPEKLKVIEI